MVDERRLPAGLARWADSAEQRPLFSQSHVGVVFLPQYRQFRYGGAIPVAVEVLTRIACPRMPARAGGDRHMAFVVRVLSAALVLAAALGGCGLAVPEKELFVNDNVPPKTPSPVGKHENFIIAHIRCEIANGVYKAKELGVPWFFPLPRKVVAAYLRNQAARLKKQSDTLTELLPDPPAPAPAKQDPPPGAKDVPATVKKDAPALVKKDAGTSPAKPALPVNLGWGASVTLKIQVQDQSGINPGVSLTTPLQNSIKTYPVGGNVTSPQSFSLGLGLSESATATRVETISYTYVFTELINDVESCKPFEPGVMIESDLKIEQFITDKATAARPGEAATGNPNFPPYSTFQDDITFVASFGGNATPTWKLARISANSTTPLISGTRTSTNEVIITLGPVASAATAFAPAQLSSDAQAVHGSSLIGSSTGSANSAQGH